MIHFACTCGMTLKVADESAGAMVKCPGCGTILIVPVKVAAVSVNRESSAPPGADSQAAIGDTASTSGEIALVATTAPSGSASDQGTSDHDPGGPPQAPGETWSLGGYRILRELGHGGMGTVYEAEDVKLERRVALKVMKPEVAKHQQQRDRFLREARTAAMVKSDFICAIYQVGEDNGVPFIAMPLLKGEALQAYLHQDLLLTDDEVVRIGKEVAQGLNAAHEAGLIHRDIKPANIWLETQRSGPPRAILLDFGLARAKADDVQITQSGAIVGTPAYMSPEQARGDKNVDARTDLFSLGCVLYLLGTGELPFKGDTTMAVLTALATRDPTPPHTISATIPTRLSRLIMRLLEKDPDDRPQLALSVVEKLVEIERDLPKLAKESAAKKIKPPTLSPAKSARTTRQMPRSGGRTASKTQEMPRGAAPSALSRKTSYALFGLITVALLGGVIALASGVYYLVFAGGKGPESKAAVESKPPPDEGGPKEAEEKKMPLARGQEPTGQVPPGWVVLKLPEANCTGAMPEQPQVSGEMGRGTQRIVTRPDGRMLVLMTRTIPPAQIARGGGSDRWLDDQINANKAGLAIQVRAESQARLQAQFSAESELSLGQYKGRETRCTKKAINPNTPYSGYTFVPVEGGAKIIRVTPDSPSGKAGLKANDIVYEAGGRAITDIKVMTDSSHQVGDELLLRVKRGEEKLELKVTLAAVPATGLEVIYMRDYLIGNTYVQVAVYGEADPPAPETADFFNSLKLGTEQESKNREQRKVNLAQAQVHAARGDWKAAAAAYAPYFADQPLEDGQLGFEYAAVLLLSGDQAGYRKLCAELLERCGPPEFRPYHAARACNLAPDSVKDAALPAKKAEDELTENRKEFWSLTEQGALAYRAGRYDAAATLLDQSLNADSKPGRAVVNWLWLSLVEHRRDNPAQARAWLDTATKWLEEYPKGIPAAPDDAKGLHLHNWLEAQVLRREAEALLGPKK